MPRVYVQDDADARSPPLRAFAAAICAPRCLARLCCRGAMRVTAQRARNSSARRVYDARVYAKSKFFSRDDAIIIVTR